LEQEADVEMTKREELIACLRIMASVFCVTAEHELQHELRELEELVDDVIAEAVATERAAIRERGDQMTNLRMTLARVTTRFYIESKHGEDDEKELLDALESVINQVVATEREECAAACLPVMSANECAAVIRAREQSGDK
jgi:hypothetical protein